LILTNHSPTPSTDGAVSLKDLVNRAQVF